ncbi:MAG: hypothetical protein U1E02_15360, partial [Hydrogenophaga sp.]|nr:hypothetical protein [Hydrogenophaga sp.]
MQCTKNVSRFFAVISLLVTAALCAQENPQTSEQNNTQFNRVYLVFGPNLDTKGVIAKNNAEVAAITGLSEFCFKKTTAEKNNLVLTSIADSLEAYPVCEQKGIARGLAFFSTKQYVVISVLASDATLLSELISAQTQTPTPEATTTCDTEIENLSELVATHENEPTTQTAVTADMHAEQLSELVTTHVNEPIAEA